MTGPYRNEFTPTERRFIRNELRDGRTPLRGEVYCLMDAVDRLEAENAALRAAVKALAAALGPKSHQHEDV